MNELLVVARYNENVDWLQKVKQNYVVYNKGPDDLPNWVKNVIKLPNIGREEYVYLKYIIDNYSCLADRVVFAQAGVLVHSPDFLAILNQTDKFQDIQPLSFGYNLGVPKYKYIIQGVTVDDLRVHVDLFDENLSRDCKISKTMLPIDNSRATQLFEHFFQTKQIRTALHNLLQIDTRKVFGLDVTPNCYAAIFSVTKPKILIHSHEYYCRLLNLSEKIYSAHISMTLEQCLSNNQVYLSDNHVRTFGIIMELMWLELFQYNLPKYYLAV